jgi:hypothetical protein
VTVGRAAIARVPAASIRGARRSPGGAETGRAGCAAPQTPRNLGRAPRTAAPLSHSRSGHGAQLTRRQWLAARRSNTLGASWGTRRGGR